MPIGLVFFGDQGTGREGQLALGATVAEWCAAHPCDAVALLGDNFYPAGVTSVDDPRWTSAFTIPYEGITADFRPALGNHDYLGDPDAQVARSAVDPRWKMPARHYTWSVGTAEFFVVDTEAFDPAQRAWLRKALEASTATWRIVYGHRPVRSDGRHAGDSRALRARLWPVLHRYGADLYLAGHEHAVEVLDAEPRLVVMGSGGAPPRPVDPTPDVSFSASQLAFGYLTLDGGTGWLEVVDVHGAVVYREALTPRRALAAPSAGE